MLAPDLSAVRAELELILSSKAFKQSPILSNFLRYVVDEAIENKSSRIKEYSIAVKALGKPPDFNPQLDAVVRIHAGRLRRILHQYYSDEGCNSPLVIEIEKGSYIPKFIARDKTETFKAKISPHKSQGTIPVNTVAVLPFKNLSGLPENDFMVDGFCEQLSSDLAQFPEIAIISYFSTSKFREERTDIRNVGKELGTSHLITGSIYRDKKNLRVSIQLVNATSGAQLWTETYNRSLQSNYMYDVFDDVLKQVVPKLVGYHGLISRNVDFSTQMYPLLHQDTVDAVFWYYHYQISYTEDVFQIARQHIEKALELNPNYALAWAVLAQLYVDGIAYLYTTVNDPLQEADRCVQKALKLDPNCQHAYLSLTWMYIFLRNKNSAIESMERCISINPRSPYYLGGASFLFSLLGEYDKSIKYFELSSILNPYYPWWFNLGPVFTHFYRGNYTEALNFANRIHIPGVFWHSIFKIAAMGQLARIKEATELADKFRVLFPGTAEGACYILKAALFDGIIYDRIKEGLLIAGLPV